MKDFIKPLYVVPVVVVAVLIVAGVLLFGGGGSSSGGNGAGSANPSLGFAEGDASALPGTKHKRSKPAPTVRTGILDESRESGRAAVAQARGIIVSPTQVRVRVSAAPKQHVTVNWQLGCFKDGHASVGKGQYRAMSPDIRAISVPVQGAKSCIATAGGQLTRTERAGRIKIAIIAG
ncbi:MAG TPA: hypothetical protein VHZ75_06195 [Solirubrobacteraceae bacterium]|nr:hypothetical protein [Solirubrobacteraceae bacterium]